MEKIHWTLLKKSLFEELGTEEKALFEEWLSSSELNRAYYARLKNFHAGSRNKQVDVDKNYKKFLHRTGFILRRRIQVVAASVAAACLLGFLFFPLAGETEPEEAMIIPGSYKAVLHLDDGRKVILDGGMDMEIEKTDEFSLRQDKNTIQYKVTESGPQKVRIHILETPHGGECTLRLSDGTEVYMNSQSQLEYPNVFTGTERRVVLRGEAYFKVSASDKPFVIEAGNMEVSVLGTEFNVRTYADEKYAHTTLVNGSVVVCVNEDCVRLKPGEQALSGEGLPLSKRTVDVSKYVAWQKGVIAFEDERLEDIMFKLAKWYNIEVAYADDSVKGIRITGSLDRYGDISMLLDKIEQLEKAYFHIEGKRITVSSKNKRL